MEKRSNCLLVVLVSLFLLPCMPLCSQGAALEMNGDVAISGAVSATSFSGSGAGLTNIPGSAIAGTSVTVNQLADGSVTPVKIGFLGKVAIVAASGGDYTNPATAMGDYAAWCGTPSATNTCLLKIMPGVYDIGSGSLDMQQYVDIEGSGENTTVITGTVSNDSSPLLNGVVKGSNNAEIRFLTVRNTGPGAYVAAVLNNGASPLMTHMTAAASGGTRNYGVYNSFSSPAMNSVTATASGGTESRGVYNRSSSPIMNNVTATAALGGDTNYGVYNYSSYPAMGNVTATASGGTRSYGVYNSSSSPAMNTVTATASGGTSNNGVYNSSSSPAMRNVTATASGGTQSYGVYNSSSSPTMINVAATASRGTTNFGVYNHSSSLVMSNVTANASGGAENYGLHNYSYEDGAFTVKIDRSTFSGSTNSISNDSDFTLRIGASNLAGGAANVSGTYTCVGVYDGDTYTALNATCH